MHGRQTLKLTSDSVREALELYVNAHLKSEAQVKVTTWSIDGADDDEITVDLEPTAAAPGFAPNGEG